jgi:hypothetical protein
MVFHLKKLYGVVLYPIVLAIIHYVYDP